jgi:hypothetical protein
MSEPHFEMSIMSRRIAQEASRRARITEEIEARGGERISNPHQCE